jgi:hypothetical protein
VVVIYKMRDIYVNESTGPVSVQLAANSGTILIGIWKKRKNMWCIFEPGSEMNIIDVLTPSQFDEAIKNKKYSLKW